MIIRFKNGSTIKTLSGGECKRSKRGQKQIEKILQWLITSQTLYIRFYIEYTTICCGVKSNETVLSFAGTEEYICVNENYDEIVSKIKTEEKKQ